MVFEINLYSYFSKYKNKQNLTYLEQVDMQTDNFQPHFHAKDYQTSFHTTCVQSSKHLLLVMY